MPDRLLIKTKGGDSLTPWLKAGDGIIFAAASFTDRYGWQWGLVVFYALNSLNGIHSELIRHRPEEK